MKSFVGLGSGAQTGGLVGQSVGSAIVISGKQVGAGTVYFDGFFVGLAFGHLDGFDLGHLVGFFGLSLHTGLFVGHSVGAAIVNGGILVGHSVGSTLQTGFSTGHSVGIVMLTGGGVGDGVGRQSATSLFSRA